MGFGSVTMIVKTPMVGSWTGIKPLKKPIDPGVLCSTGTHGLLKEERATEWFYFRGGSDIILEARDG
jgi:hypothetical protein